MWSDNKKKPQIKTFDNQIKILLETCGPYTYLSISLMCSFISRIWKRRKNFPQISVWWSHGIQYATVPYIMYTYKEKLKEIIISRLCQTILLLSKDAASATFTNSLGYMWSLYIENTRWVLIYEPQITVFPFTVAPHGLAPLRRYYVIVNSFKYI